MTLCAAPIRFAFSATLLAVVSMTCAAADRSGSGDISDRETQRCAKIAVAPAVQFQGRMLVELPDIKAPALKRANVLLSNRCFEQALKLLEEHAGQYPDDFQSNYVGARYVWMTRGEDEAEKVLRATLARQPNFISAQVLLAGIHYERGDIVAARAILDEVGSRAPTDVWVYLNRLRIQSLSPTTVPGLRETLLAMAKEPGFPGNVRETAATVGKRLPWMSTQQYEEFLRVQLDFESATPMPCKYANLAGRISRAGGRSREVIALLESPQAYNANCRGLTRNRVFLAEVYLLEAAKISPGPTSANEKLVARARELLDEDFTELVAEVTVRPEFATLKPFFGEAVHFDRPDENGHTPLCTAVRVRNPEALQAQLEVGANPNQMCGGWRPLGLIMSWAGPERASERYEMTRLLLEYGGEAGDLSECRSARGTDCPTLLLPLLEKFEKRK